MNDSRLSLSATRLARAVHPVASVRTGRLAIVLWLVASLLLAQGLLRRHAIDHAGLGPARMAAHVALQRFDEAAADRAASTLGEQAEASNGWGHERGGPSCAWLDGLLAAPLAVAEAQGPVSEPPPTLKPWWPATSLVPEPTPLAYEARGPPRA